MTKVDEMVECPVCDGTGILMERVGMTSNPFATYDIVEHECGVCRGEGRVSETLAARVEITLDGDGK